jgi:hypothetical protein
MEAKCSSETSCCLLATWQHSQEDHTMHPHRHVNLKWSIVPTFSYTIYYHCFVWETKSIAVWSNTAGSWLGNPGRLRAAWTFGPPVRLPSCCECTSSSDLFRATVSINYRKLNRIVRLFSNKNCVFISGSDLKGPYFKNGMFVFTGVRPVMDKIRNTEYEYDPSNRSGSSEEHIHTDRRKAFQKKYFLVQA